MAPTAVDRVRLRQEFARLGVEGDFLEPEQPKYDYYRHKPQLNVSGKVVGPINTLVPNNPAAPDTVARLAARGVYPYRCGPMCKCPWARARDWTKAKEHSGLCCEPPCVEGTYTEPEDVSYAPTLVLSPDRVKELQEEKAQLTASIVAKEVTIRQAPVAIVPECLKCDWKGPAKPSEVRAEQSLALHVRHHHQKSRYKRPKHAKARVQSLSPAIEGAKGV